MNYSAVAAIVSLCCLVLTIVGVVYGAGRLAERLSDHTETLADHTRVLDTHSTRLGAHDVEIAKLAEWKAGYNAAIGHHREVQ